VVDFLTSPAAAAALGVDHTRVFVSGDSAGGNLAVASFLHLWRLHGNPEPQAARGQVGSGEVATPAACSPGACPAGGSGGDPTHVRGLALIYPALSALAAASGLPSTRLFATGYPVLTTEKMEWYYDLYLPGPELRSDPRVGAPFPPAACVHVWECVCVRVYVCVCMCSCVCVYVCMCGCDGPPVAHPHVSLPACPSPHTNSTCLAVVA
jgi:acetyl esterase/lipase